MRPHSGCALVEQDRGSYDVRVRALLVFAALAICCTRSADRVGPSPENKVEPVPPPSPPPMTLLTFGDVRWTYGGTAPAFFVWAEATTRVRVTNLRATSFEITAKGVAWVSGAQSTIAVRKRAHANGQGDVAVLTTPIEPGAPIHLEVFGPLALSPFGHDAGYPTEDRAFRVELVADQGKWTLTGKCVVGPAG